MIGRLSREITNCFASYYATLYLSQVNYSMDDLHTYLSDVDFSIGRGQDREQLDSITLKEVQRNPVHSSGRENTRA